MRSKEEILATLDERGRLDNLPFQPEMFAFCGRRMRVAKVAHKTCDNIERTGGRWMRRAYHLEDGRCDGSAHGGCEADCVFFWKGAWLRPEDSDVSDTGRSDAGGCTEEVVVQNARAAGQEHSSDPTWVCQTTALFEATQFLPWWDVRQYVKDVTSGNHSAWHMLCLLTAAMYRNLVGIGIGYNALVGFYDWFQRLRGGKPYPVIEGAIPLGKRTPTELLDLEVGELVEVKSGEEIAKTLNVQGFNRGMRYDKEMLKYSGGRYRVQMRVERLIHEQTGKMLEMKNPCIQLENVFCRAECTPMRIGCPRASNTYWREIWLRRVAESEADEAGAEAPAR